MNSEGWRVDPDGVAGVLTGVDDTASRFEQSREEIEEAAFEGGGTLIADGRTTLSSAWEVFLEDRRLVPGKIMYAINAAAGAVSEATVAVVAGDEQMAGEMRAAAQRAEDAWGIGSPANVGLIDGGRR
ncbi:DUF6507 family protein [Microbacterium sp. NPDC090003]|uniref:DUF6507 family protein n=1 Tax=Microbacterium sp. NPDC090003 TaxID=3364203 RepID=UPI0037FEFA5B